MHVYKNWVVLILLVDKEQNYSDQPVLNSQTKPPPLADVEQHKL